MAKKIKYQFTKFGTCSCGEVELSAGVQDTEIDNLPVQTHCMVCGEENLRN